MVLKHKLYKPSPRAVLLALAISLFAAGLSSCNQADSEPDFEPIAPPPLEIPPVEPPSVPDSGADSTSPSSDIYSPLPTAPTTGEATTPSPYSGFEVTPTTPIPNSVPNSTIPFSTDEPVIPPPSSGIQVAPQSPLQSAPVPAPTAPAPAVPNAMPNVAPNPVPNAAPGTVPNANNPGIYVPPPSPASAF